MGMRETLLVSLLMGLFGGLWRVAQGATTMLNLTHDDCQLSRMKGPYEMNTPWQYSSNPTLSRLFSRSTPQGSQSTQG